MQDSKIIAITGGIGAGKSIVSRVLVAMGYPVYDCDSRARLLMDTSYEIKEAIGKEIAAEIIVDGEIDRKMLAQIVFNDSFKLKKLNHIVHHRVREDIKQWAVQQKSQLVFVETAILYQSELDRMVDEVWDVIAPMELRIERVMRRNAMCREDVLARIESQDSFVPQQLHHTIHQIINDEDEALLPQIIKLKSSASRQGVNRSRS